MLFASTSSNNFMDPKNPPPIAPIPHFIRQKLSIICGVFHNLGSQMFPSSFPSDIFLLLYFLPKGQTWSCSVLRERWSILVGSLKKIQAIIKRKWNEREAEMISWAGSGAAGHLSATGRGDAQYYLKEYPENIIWKISWKYHLKEYPENIISNDILKISS